jgi:hypothetical protein
MPTNYQVDGDILQVSITGDLSLVEAAAAQSNTARIANERGVRKVLVDLRGTSPSLSTVEYFEFASSFVELFPRETRHGVVFDPETYPAEDAHFLETVARNRGAVLRMFSDLDEARDWLDD